MDADDEGVGGDPAGRVLADTGSAFMAVCLVVAVADVEGAVVV